MNTPPPAPTRPPTIGISTTWPYLPQSHVPATAIPQQPLYQQPMPSQIPVLPADHHHTVDWARVRRTVKFCVRPSTVTGAIGAPFYAHWALPLAVQHGPLALGGLAFIITVYAAVGGAVGRFVGIAVLVAAGLGTLLLFPATLAHYLFGA